MNISRQVFLLFKLFETTIKILNNKQQRHKQPLKHSRTIELYLITYLRRHIDCNSVYRCPFTRRCDRPFTMKELHFS